MEPDALYQQAQKKHDIFSIDLWFMSIIIYSTYRSH